MDNTAIYHRELDNWAFIRNWKALGDLMENEILILGLILLGSILFFFPKAKSQQVNDGLNGLSLFNDNAPTVVLSQEDMNFMNSRFIPNGDEVGFCLHYSDMNDSIVIIDEVIIPSRQISSLTSVLFTCNKELTFSMVHTHTLIRFTPYDCFLNSNDELLLSNMDISTVGILCEKDNLNIFMRDEFGNINERPLRVIIQ